MSNEKEIEILKRFADTAALAGIRGKVEEEKPWFIAGFSLPDERSQMVYVRAFPEAVKGRDVVTIFSPCRTIKKGFLKGFEKAQALELLKENGKMIMGRYHITEEEDDFMVWVSVDANASTLDAEEVEAYFWLVALAADRYEKKYGGDNF